MILSLFTSTIIIIIIIITNETINITISSIYFIANHKTFIEIDANHYIDQIQCQHDSNSIIPITKSVARVRVRVGDEKRRSKT